MWKSLSSSAIATDVTTVMHCPYVWPSVTLVYPAKAAGRNAMPFGRDTCVVQCNIILNRGPGPPQEREISWGLKPQSKFAMQIEAKPLQIADLLLDRL